MISKDFERREHLFDQVKCVLNEWQSKGRSNTFHFTRLNICHIYDEYLILFMIYTFKM